MDIDMSTEHWDHGKCPKYDCKKDACKCGLKKVFLASVLGDDGKDSPIAPKNGAYCNAIVAYEANGHIYIYSSEGIPTLVETEGSGLEEAIKKLEDDLANEVTDRAAADNILQTEIDDLKNSPDVVDIVPTYAALQAYDTSKLGNNDIIRVLQDETHDGQSTYYRWNKQSSSWTYIGAVGDYYTKGQVDTLLTGKQNTLTAGANVQISPENVISATDTTYTHFTGATSSTDGTAGLVPAPVAGDDTKFLSGDGTWGTPAGTTYTAGTNVQISAQNVISATDTTYSAFTGTDGQTAGTAGLVPAPATTDAGKYLKADGTWDTVNAGPTVVQTTGTSQTDVMSQDATTSMVFKDPSAQEIVKIGKSAVAGTSRNVAIGYYATANNTYSVAVGGQSYAPNDRATALGSQCNAQSNYSLALGNGATVYSGAPYSVAIGYNSKANQNFEHSVALGDYASTTRTGEINIGAGTSGNGYNSTNYRVLGGVHDPVDAHDAATKGYVDGRVTQNAGAPTTSTTGTVGQLLEDTTNGKLYQCTAIDTTDPQNPSYTWTEVGAGGGGPTVVQAIGDSTTDVMSQNAVGKAIYDSVDSTRGYRPKIGYQASTGGLQSVAFGDDAKAAGSNAVAVGGTTRANQNGAIALGYGASTSSVGEMNIGTSNTSYGYNSTNYRLISGVHDPVNAHDAATKGYVDANAGGDTVYSTKTTSNSSLGGAVYIGNLDASQVEQADPTTTDNHYKYFWALPGINSSVPKSYSVNILGSYCNDEGVVIGNGATNAIGYYATAIGSYATVRSEKGVAIGNSAYVDSNLDNSVALGSRAVPTRAGEVNVGNSLGQGYNNTNYRVIGGVHDGVDNHDAATYGQLNTRLDGLTLLKITQTAYDQLQTKDPNTLYVITGA